LHRLETAGETMRATLNVLATVAPEWLRMQVSEAWIDRYEKRFEGYRLPKGKAARFSTKPEVLWAGYKVHLAETCDEELPHLITHVETTPATTYDGAVTVTIHEALEAIALPPEEHIVDSG
ncbi:MAG: IS5/IS1182 family transposase, partial [Ktedonobacteraceae bacterium]